MAVAVCSLPPHPLLYHPSPHNMHHLRNHRRNSSRAGPSSLPPPAPARPYPPPKVHTPARRSGPLEVSLSAPFFGRFSPPSLPRDFSVSRSASVFPDYVVDRLVDTVTASLDPVWRVEQSISLKEPRLRWWVEEVIAKSRCRTSTVLVALTYLDRARPNMRISPGAWACERALIGSLILANKVRHPSSPTCPTIHLTTAICLVHQRRGVQHPRLGTSLTVLCSERRRPRRAGVVAGSPLRPPN